MSDSPQVIIQKVILELEQQIRGQGKVQEEINKNIASLTKMNAILSQNNKLLSATSKSYVPVNKSLITANSLINNLSKSTLSSVKSMSIANKTAFNFGKSVGGWLGSLSGAFGTVGIGVLGLIKGIGELSKKGEQFTRFAIATGKGSSAVRSLRESYSDLVKTSDQVLVSITDVTIALNSFASQGFTQMQMASTKGTQDMIASLQNSFAKTGLGQEFTNSIVSSVTSLFSESTPLLGKFQNDWMMANGDILRQIEVLRGVEWIDRTKVAQAIGALTTAYDVASGKADNAITANVIFENLMEEIDAAVENLNQTLLDVFGSDMAGLIKSFSSSIQEAIKYLDDFGRDASIIWSVMKAYFYNLTEDAKWATSVIIGSFQWMISAIAGSFGALLEYVSFGELGSDIKAWAKEVGESASKSLSFQPSYADYNDVVLDAAENWKRKHESVSKITNETTSNLSETAQKLSSLRTKMGELVQSAQFWNEQNSITVKSAETTVKLFGLIGDKIKVAGRALDDIHLENIQNEVAQAARTIRETEKEAFDNAEKSISLIKQRTAESLKNAKTSEEADKIQIQSQAEINAVIKDRDVMLSTLTGSYEAINNAINQINAKSRVNLEIASAQKSVYQRQLDISKALYGTPALGVQSMLKVTQQMQVEKEILQEQLENVRSIVEYLESQGIESEELVGARKMQLELEDQILAKNAEQLNMLKELRDGYLDAVQAQAFGAGEFEKIIINQEKNLGIAADKRLIKQNYLLGQTGEAANKSRVSPYKFGESFGQMVDMQGRTMDESQMNSRRNAVLENIQDPAMRAALEESMNMISGVQSEAANAYSKASERQVEAIENQVQSTDRLTSALNDYANKASRSVSGISGIKGGVNESVIAGEAAAKAANIPQLITKNASVGDAVKSIKTNYVQKSGKSFDELGLTSNLIFQQNAINELKTRAENATIYNNAQAKISPKAKTSAGRKSPGSEPATNKGTASNNLVEAGKMLKKAAEVLSFAASDIDNMINEDRMIGYSTLPAIAGGHFLPGGP